MHLNMDQKRIIRSEPKGHSLLKGVAGSGKTTVAIHRVKYLLDEYCSYDDKILFTTYTKTLINYCEFLIKKVQSDKEEETMSIFGNSSNSRNVDVYNIDRLTYSYFQMYKDDNNLNYELIPANLKRENLINELIAKTKKDFPNVEILHPSNTSFLLEEIGWIKASNYMEISEYQVADRLGRMSFQGEEGPKRLLKNSNTRQAIHNLMFAYNQELQSQGYIDYYDMALYALKQAISRPVKRYTHILIDEGQDLTRVHYEFLKQLYIEKKYSSIFFVADTAQSIYSHAWLARGRNFTSLGFDMTGKSSSLKKNYRTTTQIAQAAYSLIENDMNIVSNENYVKPSLIDKEGSFPVLKSHFNSAAEIMYCLQEIDKIRNNHSLRDIAIIAKTHNQLSEIKNYLDMRRIENDKITSVNADFDKDSIKLITMHSIKGLEFPFVFIIGLNEGIIPFGANEHNSTEISNERKLLYVGMTRASKQLYLSSSGTPSRFLDEINKNYLRLDTSSSLRRFYNVPIRDYKFKDKISEDRIYSNEEKIRQWFINELIETYKYPIELIDIEYKIFNFSSTGFADIVVSIYKEGEKTPFIIIETKALNSGITDALGQLKSYLVNCKKAKYGVVTDGSKIEFLDEHHRVTEDIPKFNREMLKNSLDRYIYYDFRAKRKCELLIDRYSPKEITLDTPSQQIHYKEDNTIAVPNYGQISAGKPIFANQEQETIYLPEDIVKSQDLFLLSVRGNSMIGANINDDDLVLIRKQSTAMDNDIVAVAISDDVILKKIKLQKDNVHLISENDEYEPLIYSAGDIRIMGKVLGVLKPIFN